MDNKRYDISKAEAYANQIINDADIRKQKYMTEVHNTVQEEIDDFKKKMSDQYAQKNYDLSSEQSALEQGKAQNIKTVEEQYRRNEQKVVNFLIEHITKVDLQIPRNLIKDFDHLKALNQLNQFTIFTNKQKFHNRFQYNYQMICQQMELNLGTIMKQTGYAIFTYMTIWFFIQVFQQALFKI